METVNLNKLIKHNDVWYKLLRYLPLHNVMGKDGVVKMEALAMWRDYVGADHVLRDNGGFMLCETVEDAVEITDEHNV